MNKKGFTLVELLAIIVILAIIMIVAAPNIRKLFVSGEKGNQNILNKKIENASKLYIAKYYASVAAKCIGGTDCPSTIKFKLDDLQRDGLLSLRGNDGCKKSDGETTIDDDISVEIKANGITYNFTDVSNGNKCFDCSTIADCKVK